MLLCLLSHGALVDESKATQNAWHQEFTTEKQVCGDVESRGQREVLIHGFNSACSRISRSVKLNLLTVERNRARVRAHCPGKDFNERGFSGPVVPEQGNDFTGICFEIDVLEGSDAPEAFGYAARLENRLPSL